MFDDDARRLFANLATVFLPADTSMPAASQTEAAHAGLDALIGAAPRMAHDLAAILRQLPQDGDAVETLEELQHRDATAYNVLRLASGATYYLDAGVRDLLGYPGQAPTATTPGSDDGYLVDGLLDHVAERGPRYRTPSR